MRRRHVLVCLGLLALLAGPTVALAQGGGSAGDQQYTDPFGSTTHSSTHTQTQTQTQQTTTSAPVTAPAATSTAPAITPAATDTSSSPVATAATGSGATLPYTGLDLWTVVGIGLSLMASGVLIRVGSRRA